VLVSLLVSLLWLLFVLAVEQTVMGLDFVLLIVFIVLILIPLILCRGGGYDRGGDRGYGGGYGGGSYGG
jgi:hypothetical protein